MKCRFCKRRKKIYGRLKKGDIWYEVCKKCWKLNVGEADAFQFK